MRLIGWLLKILIFVALLGFALGNTEPVRVGVFGNQDLGMTAPLVVFLLGFCFMGLLIGLLVMLPRIWSQKREISRQRRELERLQDIVDQYQPQDAVGVIEPSSARLPAP
ncbi:MAG: LapA family protein [Lautropia sp.]|nr:LapA family protein [Lautropia sp.]